jgi:hypothetical protein
LLLLLLGLAGLGSTGCNLKCSKLSDCPQGQFCDPDSQQCVKSCSTDSDCGHNERCDPDFSYCRPGPVPPLPLDATLPDGARTSTATDGSHTSTLTDGGAALG